MRPFESKVVWITGGGSGIGEALAVELARQGAHVAVSGRRVEKLAEVVARIESVGGTGLAVPCDVAEPDSLFAAVDQIVAELGRLDVAVANAGISISGRLEQLSADDWRKQLEVNVVGLAMTAKAALPQLRRTQGRLVLVGSVAGMAYAPGAGPYNASKAAVWALGETWHAELAGSGVTVTAIHPGFIESDIAKTGNDGVFRPDADDPRPKALMWSGARAARSMARAIRARRRLSVITGHGVVAVWLARFAPGFVAWALSLDGRRKAKKLLTGPSEAHEVALTQPPVQLVRTKEAPFALVLGRAALASRKPQGSLAFERAIPELRSSAAQRLPDPGRLEAYHEVCGLPKMGPTLPICFPETMFLDLFAEIITHADFPLSPLGLVHVGQAIVQHKPIPAHAALDLRARLAHVEVVERGVEVRLETRVELDGELVWEGTTELLSRSQSARSRLKSTTQRSGSGGVQGPSFALEAAADTGRRYAAASGDYNPHHLWPLTARLVGYRRPIAHGMWTLARALAVLDREHPIGLPTTLTCRFKRPLWLPGKGLLRVDGGDFEVRDEAGVPILVAQVEGGGF